MSRALAICLLILLPFPGFAASPGLPDGWRADRFEPVGYTLDDRPAFKLTVTEKDGRWYLYAAHFWQSGFSVVDVTDPARQEVLRFVEDTPNTYTYQVDLHGDLMITSRERPFLPGIGDRSKPYAEGVVLWDVSDPASPARLGEYRTGGGGTHRNFYGGGRYMHLSASMPGYRGNIYVIVDVSDPSRPREAGRWWVPGQHEAGGEVHAPGKHPHAAMHDNAHGSTCGSDAEVHLHGPPYVVDDLAYLPYGSAGMVVLDISDVTRPRRVGQLDFSPPFNARFGVHGVLPVPAQGIAYANSESVEYGRGAMHHASIVDIRDPATPTLLSLLPEPVPEPAEGQRDYFGKGGWRGPHNLNHLQHNPAVEKQEGLLYMTWFNAGLRAFDVSNPRQPLAAGYFLPPEPTRRHGALPAGRLVLQTEDVVVDRRGNAYISDKNQGVWIVRYTGVRPPAPDRRRDERALPADESLP